LKFRNAYLLPEQNLLVDEGLGEEHAMLEVHVVIPRPVDQIKHFVVNVLNIPGNVTIGVALEIIRHIWCPHVTLRIG
jgi:hypothetical protein